MDGVSTRETLLVSRSVAEKIGALRDACGGVAVVVSLPRGSQFAGKPAAAHAAVLLGNVMGEVCCRFVRTTDFVRARGLHASELAKVKGDTAELASIACAHAAQMRHTVRVVRVFGE